MSEYQSKQLRQKQGRRHRAHLRIRNRVQGTGERPRLAVNRSLQYVYAQIIDDEQGHTLVQANSRESAVMDDVEASASSRAAARQVGKVLAERAKAKGIESVVFDRGGYVYHGKVRELAEGAREAGLKF